MRCSAAHGSARASGPPRADERVTGPCNPRRGTDFFGCWRRRRSSSALETGHHLEHLHTDARGRVARCTGRNAEGANRLHLPDPIVSGNNSTHR